MQNDVLKTLEQISEYDMAYAEEDLLLQVTEQIAKFLAEHQLRQSDLATALGVSDARVSQLMSGEANPTLKTVARLGLALGGTVTMEFEIKSVADQFTWSPLVLASSLGDESEIGLAA